MTSELPYQKFMGICLNSAPLSLLTTQVESAISGEGPKIRFACANPHSLVVAMEDTHFRDALNDASQVVSDGVGLVWVAKLLGIDVSPRITGMDYFSSVMDLLSKRGGGRVFFLGSTPEVLERIQKRALKDYPSLEFVGVYSPPFGEWSAAETERVIKAINQSNADVLWVGMTAPKQEKWVKNHHYDLDIPLIGSIGAVFDFYAGTHPRAPEWMNRSGLEWLHRLLREPRRMWRRNFISTPLFVWHAVRDRLREVLIPSARS